DIRRRHDHLGGKRFIATVAGPIEISLENNPCARGNSGFQRLAHGTGAPEHRTGKQRGRVPADALTCEARALVARIDADAQWPLPHVLQAAEASRRLDKTGVVEIVGAASAEKHLARREATDDSVEAEARLRGWGACEGAARRRDRGCGGRI